MPANSEETREAVLARAMECASQGRIEDAEEILRRALAHHPADALLWFRLGSLYLDAERFTDAADSFREALKADPENPLVLNDLGYALNRSGNSKAADKAYAHAAAVVDKALDADPGLLKAVLALGEISESRGDADRALDYYHRALAREPSNEDALLKTATLEMNQCRFDAAATCFQAYIELSPANEHASLSLATCLQELGRSREALEIYRRLLAVDRSRYYTVIKNLMSSARGVIWLRSSELRKILLPEET